MRRVGCVLIGRHMMGFLSGIFQLIIWAVVLAILGGIGAFLRRNIERREGLLSINNKTLQQGFQPDPKVTAQARNLLLLNVGSVVLILACVFFAHAWLGIPILVIAGAIVVIIVGFFGFVIMPL
jgi:hypothetical protein